MQRTLRLKRELHLLSNHPPHGISCWQEKNKVDLLKAVIVGNETTPYAGGVFELDIFLTERYPFEPPKLRFLTPIYHPNIDASGRICLDTLKMPPLGAWKPSLNIGSVLTTIQLLMAEPNPDDPLMADIASEYKFNRQIFNLKAKEHTNKHARRNTEISDAATSTSCQSTTAGNQLQNKRSITNKENLDIYAKRPRV